MASGPNPKTIGSHWMRVASSSTSDAYPDDGVGSSTGTAGTGILANATNVLIENVVIFGSDASSATTLDFIDASSTTQFSITIPAALQEPWPIQLGNPGIYFDGEFGCVASDTDVQYVVFFRVIA